MNLSFLPHVNAALNGLACVFLVIGLFQIKSGHVTTHRNCMIAAAAASGLFLVCYSIHYVWRASVVGGSHTPYHGAGGMKTFYYTVLLSHISLAVTVPVLAVWLVRLALAQRFKSHRRLAKIGFPVWMYVSVTGVLIYLMLYWFNPSS